MWGRQGRLFENLGVAFEVPENAKLIAQTVIIDGGERYEMVGLPVERRLGGRERAREHIDDDPMSIPHTNQLTGFGYAGGGSH